MQRYATRVRGGDGFRAAGEPRAALRFDRVRIACRAGRGMAAQVALAAIDVRSRFVALRVVRTAIAGGGQAAVAVDRVAIGVMADLAWAALRVRGAAAARATGALGRAIKAAGRAIVGWTRRADRTRRVGDARALGAVLARAADSAAAEAAAPVAGATGFVVAARGARSRAACVEHPVRAARAPLRAGLAIGERAAAVSDRAAVVGGAIRIQGNARTARVDAGKRSAVGGGEGGREVVEAPKGRAASEGEGRERNRENLLHHAPLTARPAPSARAVGVALTVIFGAMKYSVAPPATSSVPMTKANVELRAWSCAEIPPCTPSGSQEPGPPGQCVRASLYVALDLKPRYAPTAIATAPAPAVPSPAVRRIGPTLSTRSTRTAWFFSPGSVNTLCDARGSPGASNSNRCQPGSTAVAPPSKRAANGRPSIVTFAAVTGAPCGSRASKMTVGIAASIAFESSTQSLRTGAGHSSRRHTSSRALA